MIWVTSDLHLQHSNIIEYCKRPFFLEEILSLKQQIAACTDNRKPALESMLRGVKQQATEHMDNTIIRNINRFVKEDDTFKIAGDFSMSRDFDTIKAYRDRINCRDVHLILGNHDYLTEDEYKQIFQKVTHRDIFNWNGKIVVIDHYSGRTWYNSHRGSYLLWGHSHGSISDYGLSFDVGVDNWDFCPLSMNQVCDLMKLKQQHHIIKDDKEIIVGEKVNQNKGIHKENYVRS